jgi:acetylornithine deacetylase/succinyl-diaminopimelate desuccinylase-like protein
MNMNIRRASVVAVAALLWAVSAVSADSDEQRAAAAARQWRQAHEHQLLEEYISFLRIPNVSRDLPNVRRNAEFVLGMLTQRGIQARLIETPGAPVVYGEWLTPGATRTYVFYAHYDGQPVDASRWSTPPFDPVLRTARLDKGGAAIPLPSIGQPINPEWRIYARSSSDDKAQIDAIVNAVSSLKAAGLRPRANIKMVFDGEEEINSPSLEGVLRSNRDLLKADLWLICDGPGHPSGRQTVTFGARGVQQIEVTVYGPRVELHSGHYGNWAPNPAMMLAQLLASMKDADGRVTIDGFYDGVVPLSPAELQAISEMPDEDLALMKEFGLARVEGNGRRLPELRALPSLNVRGMTSARVGAEAANVIPATATAALDLRLVKGIGHAEQADRLIAHIRKQGYYVTTAEPDDATRLRYPKIARVVVDETGYDSVRTPMDLPAAGAVIDAVRSAQPQVILEPTMGGSVPLAMIERTLDTHTIVLPVANYDNNQHSSNENIRIQNLWNAIEVHAALLLMQ